MRSRDSRTFSESNHADSYCRISRRMTSSFVRELPPMFTRRTYTRRPGSTTMVKRDRAVLLVRLRHRVGRGERVAERRHPVGDALGDRVEPLGVERLAGLHVDQGGQFFLEPEQLAGQLDAGHRVALALEQVDVDEDVVLVRADRDLGRLDPEVEEAAVEVEGPDRLEVGAELLPRILVALRVPGQPVGRRQFHRAAQRRVAEDVVARERDRPDAGDVALVHDHRHVDAVALDRRHGRLDFDAVQAARQVLAPQFLLGALQQRTVEDAAFRETDFAQGLDHLFLVELLDAGQFDGRDGRTLLDQDDQHVAVDLELHVLEESAGIQRAYGLRAPLRIEAVADAHRQVAEDRSGLSALHALDTNVADREFLRHGVDAVRGHHRGGNAAQGCRHAAPSRHATIQLPVPVRRRGCGSGEQPDQVVVERQHRQQSEQRNPGTLAPLDDPLRWRAALENLDQIIQ